MSVAVVLGNKVIVVTGGSGLLGKELVKGVANSGGIGVIADIDRGMGEEAMIRLRQETKNGSVDFIELDINSKASIENSLSVLKKRHGQIDALVNCAYPRIPNYGRPFFDVEYTDFCTIVSLHLGGYFLTSQQYAKHFESEGHGTIINIASVYGTLAPRFEIYENTSLTMPVEYAVIKSGIIHLTRYMAKYLRSTGIRVNCVSPGGVYNGQPESFVQRYNDNCLTKGMLEPRDLTGAVLFLLSDDSAYVNGQNLIVDDGFTL